MIAVIFLAFGRRLLPRRMKGHRNIGQAFEVERYTTELVIPDNSPILGQSVRELEALSDGELVVSSIVRPDDDDDERHFVPGPQTRLAAGDILSVQAEPAAVKAVTDAAGLELAASKELKPPLRASDDLEIIEAVVMPQSRLVGQNARRLQLRRRFEV